MCYDQMPIVLRRLSETRSAPKSIRPRERQVTARDVSRRRRPRPRPRPRCPYPRRPHLHS